MIRNSRGATARPNRHSARLPIEFTSGLRPTITPRRSLSRKSFSQTGDVLSLEIGDGQLPRARHTAAIAIAQCGRTVGRPPRYFLHVVQSWAAVGYADYNHPMMQKGDVERGERCFLPTMLTCRTGEYAAELSDQFALAPELACLVEKTSHLPAHVAKAGGSAEDDGIVIRQLFRSCDWSRLVRLGVNGRDGLRGHRFRYTLHGSRDPRDRSRPGRHFFGHPLNMTPSAVVENQYFCH